MSPKQSHDAAHPSRKAFLRGAGALGLGVGASLALGTPGAMAERVGRPLGKKTTIRYYGLYWLGTEIKRNQQLVAQFNSQSTSVQLQYVQSSWSSIANQMTVAFSSGDVPDVFQYYDAGLVPWGQNGLLTDLKKLLPTSTWNGVNPGTLSALTTRQGAVIGLPYETETPLIYYNVDMFKQAGIKPAPAGQPWTWDQLRANAERLSNPMKGVYGIVAQWTSSQLFFKSGLGWLAMLGKTWDPAMFAVFQGKSTYDQFVAKVNKDGTDFVQTAAGNY